MVYTLRFNIPGLPLVEASSSTFFACVGLFLLKLDLAGESKDAAHEVREDIMRGIAALVAEERGEPGSRTYCTDLEGGTLIFDLTAP